MSRKDIRLKDDQGNYLYPQCHLDDDGNIIKTTYLKVMFNSQIVKDVCTLYAYSNVATEAPADEKFLEDPAECEKGVYLWQATFTTYLNNTTRLGKKINLTSALSSSSK